MSFNSSIELNMNMKINLKRRFSDEEETVDYKPKKKRQNPLRKLGRESSMITLNRLFPDLEYKTILETGPGHRLTFTMGVKINGTCYLGTSDTKMNAKKIAAKNALRAVLISRKYDSLNQYAIENYLATAVENPDKIFPDETSKEINLMEYPDKNVAVPGVIKAIEYSDKNTSVSGTTKEIKAIEYPDKNAAVPGVIKAIEYSDKNTSVPGTTKEIKAIEYPDKNFAIIGSNNAIECRDKNFAVLVSTKAIEYPDNNTSVPGTSKEIKPIEYPDPCKAIEQPNDQAIKIPSSLVSSKYNDKNTKAHDSNDDVVSQFESMKIEKPLIKTSPKNVKFTQPCTDNVQSTSKQHANVSEKNIGENTITILNQLMGREIVYETVTRSYDMLDGLFLVKCTILGQVITGYGCNLLEAKKAAAKSALLYVLNLSPNTQTTSSFLSANFQSMGVGQAGVNFAPFLGSQMSSFLPLHSANLNNIASSMNLTTVLNIFQIYNINFSSYFGPFGSSSLVMFNGALLYHIPSMQKAIAQVLNVQTLTQLPSAAPASFVFPN